MKKFAAPCAAAGLEVVERETLQGRAGRYINALRQNGGLDEISHKIAKSTVQIFEQFNHVRNNSSLAHDNDLLKRAEGQYVLETVLSLLRFVRALDEKAFGR
ncbi:abortive infection family protein [Caulobacter segnis]